MEICEYVPPENDLLLRDDNFVMYHAFKVDRVHIYYRFYLQFVPGTVLDVCLNKKSVKIVIDQNTEKDLN